jgi:hypothetical protein
MKSLAPLVAWQPISERAAAFDSSKVHSRPVPSSRSVRTTSSLPSPDSTQESWSSSGSGTKLGVAPVCV